MLPPAVRMASAINAARRTLCWRSDSDNGGSVMHTTKLATMHTIPELPQKPFMPTPPVALVTGAARRIGAAIARRLHAQGYALTLHCHTSRNEVNALARELEAIRPGSTLVVAMDLAETERLPELVTQTLARFGQLDALINNASAFHPTPLRQATPAQWDALFASNARAPFFLAQAAAPHLRASGGVIVNLADIYGQSPLRDHAIYSSAKAALVMATRALALELAPHVRVNAVAPGAILWPEHTRDTQRERRILASIPLARTGTPEDIAGAVYWLLSGARYVTGQVLRVDGGRGLD